MVSSTPRPHFTSGKDLVPILQEAGWAPGPVWTGGKSRPHRDSIPDRSACSQALYRLSYPAHSVIKYPCEIKSKFWNKCLSVTAINSYKYTATTIANDMQWTIVCEHFTAASCSWVNYLRVVNVQCLWNLRVYFHIN